MEANPARTTPAYDKDCLFADDFELDEVADEFALFVAVAFKDGMLVDNDIEVVNAIVDDGKEEEGMLLEAGRDDEAIPEI